MMHKLLKTKCSKCLSVQQKLYLKGDRCHSTKCPFERNNIHLPGRHIAFNRRNSSSSFAKFIISKRIVKAKYRITISYLKKLLDQYSSSEYLNKLESRLDNTLYRIGIFSTISSARQYITHKSIKLNNKAINLPGLIINKGDVISFVDESKIKNFQKKISNKSWFTINDNIITIVADIKMENPIFDLNVLTSGLLRS